MAHLDRVELQLYGKSGNSEGDAPLVNDQYRPRIHFFKAQIHLLNRNVKACKKELKSYTTIASNVSRRESGGGGGGGGRGEGESGEKGGREGGKRRVKEGLSVSIPCRLPVLSI